MPEWVSVGLVGIAWVLMLVGCVFVIAGGVGLIRLPDLYTRLHAAGVTDTGSTIFMLLAMILVTLAEYQNPWIAGKLLLILFFTLFTTPTASHALAKTALLSGHVPSDEHGNPILDSPETAQKLAMSRAPKHGNVAVAPGVSDAGGEVDERSNTTDPDDTGSRS